eukprot:TRINITY_DN6126_c0_g2_i1.p1 TRINITY_DN6126_c0_g2~~TRINITY_DN6126_c0_g2_i1.p1  ORF type:complete len:465 (+),score=139.47 TRINITY_DN6126_c0_g2_i1:40-1395(+)
MSLEEPEVIHVDIDPDMPVTRIDSLCYECGENGTTTFYLTKIPHFKEIIISSFICEYCDYHNNSVQYGGSIEPKGVRYSLRINDVEDLNRQLVKSDYAYVYLPELDFEIPSETQKGILSTVEGILTQARDNIAHLQPVRREVDPENAQKIDEFLDKLQACIDIDHPFIIIVDDYSGNSFIENPFAPAEDPEMIVTYYERSREQDESLGINVEAEEERRRLEQEAHLRAIKERKEANESRTSQPVEGNVNDGQLYRNANADASVPFNKDILSNIDKAIQSDEVDERVLVFKTPCSACTADGTQRMITVDIPYFKEVIIMAFYCDNCGYKNSEVKTGGSVSPLARKHILRVENEIDLARDILKSDSASLEIPELDFAVQMGSMGAGGFTTVEGVLNLIKDTFLKNPFLIGDSATQSAKERYKEFNEKLKRVFLLHSSNKTVKKFGRTIYSHYR